ncbi:MAG: hypothetical protein ABIP53_07715 [Candidatus Limnocylindrales bacterium]
MEYPSPDQPAAPPPPPGQAEHDVRAASGGRSRFGRAVRHPEATAAALAIMIGFASVFTALIAWRASLASIDASRYESLAVQQQARGNQIDRELESVVAQDLRFVNVYQEHALAARELRTQADELRATDAATADILDLQAQSRLDLARAVIPFFQGAQGVSLDADGTVPYDTAYVLTNLRASNSELRELATQNTAMLAQHADARALGLVGVAALVVAALLFLTIAQVARAGSKLRQAFFGAGSILVLVGVLGFGIVELFA